MKRHLGAWLCLFALTAQSETAYVSDELVLGVYPEQEQKGDRIATLHSGSAVEIIAREGDFTQVRLANGSTGWVKSSFLTNRQPAAVRVKQLEEQLSQARATTPAMAEAAARSELQTLKQQLDVRQKELDALKRTPLAEPPSASVHAADRIGMILLVGIACLGAGFACGHAMLARRIKRKFGGIKVY